ncbi:MAG: PHA/PHB synthase family protein [Aquabacterium sp.]
MSQDTDMRPDDAPSPLNTRAFQDLDRFIHAQIGHVFTGLSPIQAVLVYLDWMSHLAISPGKQMLVGQQLLEDSVQLGCDLAQHMYPFQPSHQDGQSGAITPQHNDRRFKAPAWAQWPFNLYAQSFLMAERAWLNATRDVPGLSHKSEDIASFAARQWLDVMAPSNLPWMNPEVLQATLQEGGQNWLRGAANWLDDVQRQNLGLPAAGVDAYRVGQNVAITPGKVVFQNDLMELIQYTPSTPQVQAEPILIVPAWIMKYYILDLSPHNSLVKYLVDQGHTVFMISWKNPTEHDRNKGLDDYRKDGVMAAVDVVSDIVPGQKIHAAGYCLGGTILMIAAATMGRDKDERLASMTLFAAQGDFTEAGELMLFINDSEVDLIDALMWEQGYLKGSQMAGTFQLLHSNDLIWSRILKEYMLGQRSQPNDLMAWNADTTRMPHRMHSEYLHKLFLHNELASGKYEVDGHPIWFTDIRVPCFAVGTMTDHVAPWKSVYKLHLLPVELTFVLTNGGHNAGIVSEPGHPNRRYQMQTRPASGGYLSPDDWQAQAPTHEGSWWLAWHDWLTHLSSGLVNPPGTGKPGNKKILPDAPGSYVLAP